MEVDIARFDIIDPSEVFPHDRNALARLRDAYALVQPTIDPVSGLPSKLTLKPGATTEHVQTILKAACPDAQLRMADRITEGSTTVVASARLDEPIIWYALPPSN